MTYEQKPTEKELDIADNEMKKYICPKCKKIYELPNDTVRPICSKCSTTIFVFKELRGSKRRH